MKHIIINNLLFFTFGLFFYFIGIFIKYLNFNIFESQLFTTLLVIYGFLSSNVFIIYDNLHPYHTLKNIYNLNKKEKIILFCSCIPFYKLLVLSYIYLDPNIIQLINSIRVGLSPIIYSIYYKEYYLYNYIIIINIIINILACIIPFIFNDNFSLKINTNHNEIFGLINTIISIILTSLCNIINEKFNLKYDFNDIFGCNTFIIYTFTITDILFSILLQIIIFIYYYINHDLDNLININNLYKIIIYTTIIGIIYGPYYILVTKCYLKLTSLNVSIINNIVLIFTIFISCILKLSKFYYLYIPAIILIVISSIIITYKLEKIKNNLIISVIT